MAQQASIIEEGVDRINSAYESLEHELQRLQKDLRGRRKSIEKRTRKQVKQLRTDLRKNPLVKRAQRVQTDVAREIERGVDGVLSALQIATKSDLQRIDRKLGQLNRKLKEIEARKTNGGAASPHV